MELEDFLIELIAIRSETGQEDEVANFISNRLSALGMNTKLFPIEGKRVNVFAGFGASPKILLSTHMDTVPPFIPASRSDDKIGGRGACDAKGILAAMVFAVLSLDERVRKNVDLLFVVGEETDSIGAKTALQDQIKADYIINGEPTGNKLVRAQKGAFIFNLTASGKAGHSGYPEHGDSAIDLLLSQLNLLQALDWGDEPELGKATLNIGKINGGEAANAIAGAATADCCLRVVTKCEVTEQLLLDNLIAGIEYKTITQSDPLELFVPKGFESIVVSFGSDAAYLSKLGKTLMVGPGDILNAHTADESIVISELYEAVEVYQKLIYELL